MEREFPPLPSSIIHPPSSLSRRPAVAIVSNSQTPYRLHLHHRLAAELPEIQLWSLFTHESSNSDWGFAAPVEIGPVSFGPGESSNDQSRPSRAPREWRRAGRIIRWLHEHDVRCVIVMGYNDLGRMRLIRHCHRAGVPCFVFGDSNIRGDLARGIKAAVKKHVVEWVVDHTAGILCCGSLGRAYFKKYRARDDAIFYFPYEPDYALMQNPPADAVSAVRAEFGLATDRRRIVYSGRLIRVKRVDVLIDAFAAIAADRPGWDLVIAGDGPLAASLRDRVPGPVRSRITWTGFQNDPARLAAVYRCCDILVLPSDYEPWALVINEAVAAGLAVVCTDVVGAAAELVRDGVNGRLFTPGDVAALTERLLDVTTPGRAAAMRDAAAAVLADWRARGDPVAGFRQALRYARVLPAVK